MRIPTVEDFLAFLGMVMTLALIIYILLRYGKRISQSDTATNKNIIYMIIFFFVSALFLMICSLSIIFFVK